MPKCVLHPNVLFSILALNRTKVEDLHRGTILPFLKGRAMPVEDWLSARYKEMVCLGMTVMVRSYQAQDLAHRHGAGGGPPGLHRNMLRLVQTCLRVLRSREWCSSWRCVPCGGCCCKGCGKVEQASHAGLKPLDPGSGRSCKAYFCGQASCPDESFRSVGHELRGLLRCIYPSSAGSAALTSAHRKLVRAISVV